MLSQRIQQVEEERDHAKLELQDYQHNKSTGMFCKTRVIVI